jgi:hypothetical protein
MSDTVLILGAGASAQAGVPVMSEFLDTAERLLREGRTGKDKESFQLVFKGIAALQDVFAKAHIDAENLEAVFAAFEMAKLFGRLGTLTPEEIERLPHAIRHLIVRTIQEEMRISVSERRLAAPEPYGDFVDALAARWKKRNAAGSGKTTSILTFNYDLAIDFSLHSVGIPVNYGLDAPDGSGRLDLLKLHGSLNWVQCHRCNRIVPWTLTEFFKLYNYRDLYDVHHVQLDVADKLTSFAHCKDAPPPHTAEPVIVPPTWSKTGHYESIAPVWRRAAAHLAEASRIIVIGYSLPDTDQFFRYLYALGTVGPTRMQRFLVVDPDARVEARFKDLLGPLAMRGFRALKGTFSEQMSYITDVIGE